ncbi:hypothetical protein HELRODRAFT_189983 [Helobdella robusta]|uniref:PWWP domain-containing protein n=1 Tax=Helobdella robusta TaxID=6412 RepID=T1FRK1_HELRO|nr:hypothetical protein HELRODRAFT_189983 [Helobdella robusta]ESO11511.1 hypothetical protein HELRODRAFT_189983 [Helobdella robusta]
MTSKNSNFENNQSKSFKRKSDLVVNNKIDSKKQKVILSNKIIKKFSKSSNNGRVSTRNSCLASRSISTTNNNNNKMNNKINNNNNNNNNNGSNNAVNNENKIAGDKSIANINNTSTNNSNQPKKNNNNNDNNKNNNKNVSNNSNNNNREDDDENGDDDLIPLCHGDFVWAQWNNSPSYPAIIVDPRLMHNDSLTLHSVRRGNSLRNNINNNNNSNNNNNNNNNYNNIIPVPSDDVVRVNDKMNSGKFLVCFYDNKRTWQWVTRSKLDPLGVDSGLDRDKISAVRRANARRPLIEAYKRSLMHRCLRFGENYDDVVKVVLN